MGKECFLKALRTRMDAEGHLALCLRRTILKHNHVVSCVRPDLCIHTIFPNMRNRLLKHFPHVHLPPGRWGSFLEAVPRPGAVWYLSCHVTPRSVSLCLCTFHMYQGQKYNIFKVQETSPYVACCNANNKNPKWNQSLKYSNSHHLRSQNHQSSVKRGLLLKKVWIHGLVPGEACSVVVRVLGLEAGGPGLSSALSPAAGPWASSLPLQDSVS